MSREDWKFSEACRETLWQLAVDLPRPIGGVGAVQLLNPLYPLGARRLCR